LGESTAALPSDCGPSSSGGGGPFAGTRDGFLLNSNRLSSGLGRTFCFQVAKNTGPSGSRFRFFIASRSLSVHHLHSRICLHGACHYSCAVYGAPLATRFAEMSHLRLSHTQVPKECLKCNCCTSGCLVVQAGSLRPLIESARSNEGLYPSIKCLLEPPKKARPRNSQSNSFGIEACTILDGKMQILHKRRPGCFSIEESFSSWVPC
jgi:hypothetical protein